MRLKTICTLAVLTDLCVTSCREHEEIIQSFSVNDETDNWPTTFRNVNFTLPNGQPFVIPFGFSDAEYYNSDVNNNIFPLTSNQLNNNSEIKFISYLQ